MIWVSWRQHRSQAVACLGLLAALAVYAIVVSSSMRTAFGQDGLVTCLARSQGTGCRTAIQAFTDRFGSEVNVAFWSVLLILPGLIGVLVGGPLIARELEYGTWRLAWSQTVSRARWLTVKLGLVTGGLVVFGAAMTALITWYRAPMDRLTGHFLPNVYDFEGLVLTAYILCAFGFAVLVGSISQMAPVTAACRYSCRSPGPSAGGTPSPRSPSSSTWRCTSGAGGSASGGRPSDSGRCRGGSPAS